MKACVGIQPLSFSSLTVNNAVRSLRAGVLFQQCFLGLKNKEGEGRAGVKE